MYVQSLLFDNKPDFYFELYLLFTSCVASFFPRNGLGDCSVMICGRFMTKVLTLMQALDKVHYMHECALLRLSAASWSTDVTNYMLFPKKGLMFTFQITPVTIAINWKVRI